MVQVSDRGGAGKGGSDEVLSLRLLLWTIHHLLTLLPLPHTHLVLPGAIDDLFVANLVHELEALQGFLDVDANVLLVQRAGAVAVVKVEQTLVLVHPEFVWGILIERQVWT